MKTELTKEHTNDPFVAIRERLRLAVLKEYSVEELTAEINGRNQGETMKIHQDDYIEVHVLHEKGAGGAHHKYSIVRKEIDSEKGGQLELGSIDFQQGNIAENGVNGITNEALLAIVEHRLDCFQSGRFPCDENASALASVKCALHYLERRTQKRKARGVEGQERR